ncbi:MAG: hypothetical protein JW829_02540 [Pirellulales bacterium]|nr:hypothetical protein [Pirellulales bacterium]
MQTRRSWFITASASLLAMLCFHRVWGAQEVPLGDRLRNGLQARSKAELAFLDHVVDLVEHGQLPQSLVDRVFFWAKKKAATKSGAKKKRPMVYFQPALIQLAKKIDIQF